MNVVECIEGGAGILCIRDKKVIYEEMSREKCFELFEVFLCALKLWRWKFDKTKK